MHYDRNVLYINNLMITAIIYEIQKNPKGIHCIHYQSEKEEEFTSILSLAIGRHLYSDHTNGTGIQFKPDISSF